MSVYYVATNGNDAADGAMNSPFLTIARAVVIAANGDTIFVREGTYAERVVINKSITLQAWDAETVIIQPPSGAQTDALLISNTHDVTLDGLTIDAANRLKGISISASYNVMISGCDVKNCIGASSGQRGQGIIASPDSICHDITITACTIYNVRGGDYDHDYGFCHAVYAACPNLLVQDCTMYDLDGLGVHVSGDEISNAAIERCYVHDAASGIGIYIGTAVVRNNVIRNCILGLTARYAPTDVRFYHNTCYDNTLSLDAATLPNGSYLEAKNNVFANGTNAVKTQQAAGSTGILIIINNLKSNMSQSSVIVGDGTYVTLTEISATFAPYTDDGAANIKPLAGNPAIGVGVDVGVTTDYSGATRNDLRTLGAWQYEPPPPRPLRGRRSGVTAPPRTSVFSNRGPNTPH